MVGKQYERKGLAVHKDLESWLYITMKNNANFGLEAGSALVGMKMAASENEKC